MGLIACTLPVVQGELLVNSRLLVHPREVYIEIYDRSIGVEIAMDEGQRETLSEYIRTKTEEYASNVLMLANVKSIDSS